MNTYYLDSSVALRVLFQEPHAFVFPKEGLLVSSILLKVECFRVLDRFHKLRQRSPSQILLARTSLYRLLETIELVELNSLTLERASQSFDVPIKTLDAIHLSTALIYTQEFETPLIMLTHDNQLGRATRMLNIEVIGDESATNP